MLYLRTQGCRCAPTSGLKLANAFGVKFQTDEPNDQDLTYVGTNSSVVRTRSGSLKPSIHVREPFVLYFSANAL